jgi:uncharacterized DUF497 family protein
MGETDDLEWDDKKDEANRDVRGLPLPLAARLFDGRPRVDDVSPKSPDGEVRFETLAEYEGRVLFCVWKWNGERRRVISLRIAHRSERRAYQEAIGRGRSSRKDG